MANLNNVLYCWDKKYVAALLTANPQCFSLDININEVQWTTSYFFQASEEYVYTLSLSVTDSKSFNTEWERKDWRIGNSNTSHWNIPNQ